MKCSVFLMVAILFFPSMLRAQKEKTTYYDKDWQVCKKEDASFYRVYQVDRRGNPTGEIVDHYISGELQSRIEGAIYIDKKDDKKSKFIGLSRGFYRLGSKQFEILHDDEGNILHHKIWYENGNLRFDASYKDGNYHGPFAIYYENGELFREYTFNRGRLKGKFFVECDEFQDCQEIFEEDFSTADNMFGWELVNDKNGYSSQILPEKGMLIKAHHGDFVFRQILNVPIDPQRSFTIETTSKLRNGDKTNSHGIVWGFKDWDNYFSFQVSTNGYFFIGGAIEGVYVNRVDWTESSYINDEVNRLKILKIGKEFYFSINGHVVHSEEAFRFKSNNLGFIIAGEQEVLFENLVVKKDVNRGRGVSLSNGRGAWKGNGSGFFISKDGYLATNNHVVEEATAMEIEFIRDGKKQNFVVEIVQTDRQNDLAILKVKDPNFIPFADIPYNVNSNVVDVGTNVFALGFPMALSVMGTEIKFTDGRISSKTGYQGNIATYQMTVPIQPGNSGGPLFDFYGNLLGINSSILRPDMADNVSYAIKASYLEGLVNVLPSTIELPNDQSIDDEPLTEKIKILSDYVVLIKVK